MQVHGASACACNGVWKPNVPLMQSINCSENLQNLSDNQLPDLGECMGGKSGPVIPQENQSLPTAYGHVLTPLPMPMLGLNGIVKSLEFFQMFRDTIYLP